MKIRSLLLASVAAGALLLGGCSEQERREVRAHERAIANFAAEQARKAQEYAADLAAAVQRQKNELDAETARQRNQNLTVLGKLASVLAAIGGVIGFTVYCIYRLGERVSEERTKRHDMTVRAIVSDPNLKPDHRERLYLRAVDSANRGGTPRLGYGGGA